jgi:DNA-directed RNA polymerase specialized sigma24 family protein
MTPERFAVIARLIRMRGGRSQEAARLVLVEGMRPVEAARATGLSLQAVCNAVARVRRTDNLLAKAKS